MQDTQIDHCFLFLCRQLVLHLLFGAANLRFELDLKIVCI